jgi:hypothetical protein
MASSRFETFEKYGLVVIYEKACQEAKPILLQKTRHNRFLTCVLPSSQSSNEAIKHDGYKLVPLCL